MLQSFYNSVSGVKTQQFGMDITANNIANVNTAGYKAATPEFKNIFAKTIGDSFSGPTNDQIGLGSAPSASALNMLQGSLENTDRTFDLAIAGDGWFNVSPLDATQNYYTRAGNFTVNGDGYLVNSQGLFLMGINANNITNNVVNPNTTLDPNSTAMGPLEIPTHLTYPAEPTTEVSLRKNLTFGSAYQKQSIGIVTPEGTKTNLIIEFVPSATQPGVGASWDYTTHVEGSTDTPLTGSLLFDSAGGMINPTVLTVNNGGTPITFDLGGAFDGIISTTGDVNTSVVANGKPEGDLTNYRVDQAGNIVASFNNSESATIGKIPLYHFINDQGLTKTGDNLFQQSANSGEATRFIDDNGEFAMGSKINSHMLEYSNEDLSVSMTNLIVFQKAFTANAKGITTSDQMIQTAINLKK
jgi:flagellar hook protein FlgE